jgi:hypothetical protein
MYFRTCCIAVIGIGLGACAGTAGPPEYLVIEEYSGDPAAPVFHGYSCLRVGAGGGAGGGGATAGGGTGGAGAPSFSISEASVGDSVDVVVREQTATLAERKYDSIFVHSGRVDDFTVTLAPGYVLRLRVWGSFTCSVPDLADAASTQSD